jgi:F-type H+-transporting ATPase subunit b
VVLSTLLLAAEKVKNPILPVGNELFWGAVCFFGLWALMKFVLLKPIVSTMEDRAAKVRDELDQAERAESELVSAIEQYQSGLSGAKADATRSIEAARAEADAYRAQVLAQAETEVAAMRSAAIAVDAASAVVQKQLDPASQMQIIEDYVNRAGSQS